MKVRERENILTAVKKGVLDNGNYSIGWAKREPDWIVSLIYEVTKEEGVYAERLSSSVRFYLKKEKGLAVYIGDELIGYTSNHTESFGDLDKESKDWKPQTEN